MKLKVALISDELQVWGGAQYHLDVLSQLFPHAPIYTSVSEQDIRNRLPGRKIINTFIQHLPFERLLRKEWFLLYPLAFRSIDLKKYDVVISISSAFSKMVKVTGKTKHIMICLTPPRFLWMDTRNLKKSSRLTYWLYETFVRNLLHKYWKRMDKNAACSVDKIVSISKEIQSRVKEFYGRDSDVIYPPVEVNGITVNNDPRTRKNWFLYLGRVETYKGVDLVINACIKANAPLVVAGTGSGFEEMKDMVFKAKAGHLIRFTYNPTDEQKFKLLARCKALIFPVKDEDFGIVPVEANAAGTPVIAYRGGGVLETLSEDNPKTAVFFDEYSVDCLAEALSSFDINSFNPDNCRKQAEQFSREIFEYKIKQLIENVVRAS